MRVVEDDAQKIDCAVRELHALLDRLNAVVTLPPLAVERLERVRNSLTAAVGELEELAVVARVLQMVASNQVLCGKSRKLDVAEWSGAASSSEEMSLSHQFEVAARVLKRG